MLISISPIVATLIYRARGTSCSATVHFVNWGVVSTDRTCLIYQLSADNLVAAISIIIDLSFITTSWLIQNSLPVLNRDTITRVEVKCVPEGGVEQKPYLVMEEVNTAISRGQQLRLMQIYAPDRTQRIAVSVVDPIATMVTKGVFGDITSDILMTDGVLIRDVPTNIEIIWRGPNTVDVQMTFQANYTPRARETIHQITLKHPQVGVVGILRHIPYQPGQELKITSTVTGAMQIS